MAQRLTKTQITAQELERLGRIATQRGRLLEAKDVVKSASHKQSPLHTFFDWSDTVAARKWRLHQAHMLMQVVVQYADVPEARTMHVLTHLRTDSDPGYRLTRNVLSDRQKREQLVAQAFAELDHFKAKYAAVEELAGVWRAMDRATKRWLKPEAA